MKDQWNHILRYTNGENSPKIVGDLEWAERPGRTFEMHLDVSPDHHRKGIGRSMVEELEGMAKLREGMSLYSFSAYDNEKAYKFFTGMGFMSYGVTDFYGKGRHAWFYVKAIGVPK